MDEGGSRWKSCAGTPHCQSVFGCSLIPGAGVHSHTCRLCSDAGFMRSIWRSYEASADDTDAGGGSARFSRSSSPHPSACSPRPRVPPFSASPRRCRASSSHERHAPHSSSQSLDSPASATVFNVVGMTGAEAGLSVQRAVMKVQWCALRHHASRETH